MDPANGSHPIIRLLYDCQLGLGQSASCQDPGPLVRWVVLKINHLYFGILISLKTETGHYPVDPNVYFDLTKHLQTPMPKWPNVGPALTGVPYHSESSEYWSCQPESTLSICNNHLGHQSDQKAAMTIFHWLPLNRKQLRWPGTYDQSCSCL